MANFVTLLVCFRRWFREE